MPDGRTWNTVEEDGDPLQEPVAKPVLAEDLEEKGPSQRVEGACEVDLEEESWDAELMQQTGRLLDQDEIVMQAAPRR